MTGADEWRIIRHYLACRSGHLCEICGRHLGAQLEPTVHHRQPRGMGGTSDPDVHALERLMLLCGGRLGGIQECHGLVEANRVWARRCGFLVPRPADPADVPVVLYSGRRVLLGYSYAPAPGLPYAERPLTELAAA